MENKTKVKNEKKKDKIKIKRIKNTPFIYQEVDNNKWITCGIVKLDVDKDISDEKEWDKWIKENHWNAIAMIAQATTYEILKETQKTINKN